jgi:membrane associated rhomboid family serine protease
MNHTPITIIFLAITLITSYLAFNNESLYRKLIMNPYIIAKRKEYYRFISSGFIHSGIVHLLFNMVTFYSFAQYVEVYFRFAHGQLLGAIYFIFLYIGGIIISDIPTYLQYKNLPHYNSLGASGGVSSVLFATILYEPLAPMYIFGVIPMVSFIMGAVFLIYSYYFAKGSNDNINHAAHFFGALFGFIFAIAVEPLALMSFFEKIASWRLGF